jgi:hypothetical protein
MKPFIFKRGTRWAIFHVLEGEPIIFQTAKWSDALTFALNLARLRAEGIGR